MERGTGAILPMPADPLSMSLSNGMPSKAASTLAYRPIPLNVNKSQFFCAFTQ